MLLDSQTTITIPMRTIFDTCTIKRNWKGREKMHTLGGIGSWDVFWYPCDGGIMTRRMPPTFIDFTAVSMPEITYSNYKLFNESEPVFASKSYEHSTFCNHSTIINFA